MDEKGFLSFLGLAARAGAVVSGFDACKEALTSGQAHLVLTDGELSEAQREKLQNLCLQANVPLIGCSATMDLGYAIGRPGRKIVAITREGFAEKMIDVLNSGVAK